MWPEELAGFWQVSYVLPTSDAYVSRLVFGVTNKLVVSRSASNRPGLGSDANVTSEVQACRAACGGAHRFIHGPVRQARRAQNAQTMHIRIHRAGAQMKTTIYRFNLRW
jgi:hypothetical protein